MRLSIKCPPFFAQTQCFLLGNYIFCPICHLFVQATPSCAFLSVFMEISDLAKTTYVLVVHCLEKKKWVFGPYLKEVLETDAFGNNIIMIRPWVIGLKATIPIIFVVRIRLSRLIQGPYAQKVLGLNVLHKNT